MITMMSVLQSASKYQTDTHTTREITALEEALKNAKQYNIRLGHVYATSGLGRLLPQFKGRSDWAIISITNHDISPENKVRNVYCRT